MKKRIIVIVLCIATLATFAACSKTEAGIDTSGPIFSEFEFGMTKETIKSMYPEWPTPIINTDQVMFFEEVDYKGIHGHIVFAFDIDEHTLEQINLNLMPKEENNTEQFNATVAMFTEDFGEPQETVEDYYAIWKFKYGDDDAVLLLLYDEGLEDIQTHLMRLDNFQSLYELL